MSTGKLGRLSRGTAGCKDDGQRHRSCSCQSELVQSMVSKASFLYDSMSSKSHGLFLRKRWNRKVQVCGLVRDEDRPAERIIRNPPEIRVFSSFSFTASAYEIPIRKSFASEVERGGMNSSICNLFSRHSTPVGSFFASLPALKPPLNVTNPSCSMKPASARCCRNASGKAILTDCKSVDLVLRRDFIFRFTRTLIVGHPHTGSKRAVKWRRKGAW